jgi:hypothetical protein
MPLWFASKQPFKPGTGPTEPSRPRPLMFASKIPGVTAARLKAIRDYDAETRRRSDAFLKKFFAPRG